MDEEPKWYETVFQLNNIMFAKISEFLAAKYEQMVNPDTCGTWYPMKYEIEVYGAECDLYGAELSDEDGDALRTLWLEDVTTVMMSMFYQMHRGEYFPYTAWGVDEEQKRIEEGLALLPKVWETLYD